MASINPVFARILTRRLLDAGVAEAELFRGTDIDPQEMWRQQDLDLESFKRLLANASELYTVMPIGFLIGTYHGTQAMGPVGAAMAAAPDLRAGLQALASFTALHTSYIKAGLVSQVNGLRVTMEFLPEIGAALQPHVEANLMLLRHYAERQNLRELRNAQYELPYPEPKHLALYQERFGMNLQFDCPQGAILYPPEALDRPSPFFHAESWNLMLRQLSQRLRELGEIDKSAFGRHIRSVLRSENPPLPSLGAMAARLHVSKRTLNRRLSDEGTSYREICSELMDEWARALLQETGDSVECIAATLGYGDTANFRRAFRARHQVSPSTFRSRVER